MVIHACCVCLRSQSLQGRVRAARRRVTHAKPLDNKECYTPVLRKFPYHRVLYKSHCKVCLLFSAFYEKCPYYLVLVRAPFGFNC